jgi:hypothetical protein
MERILPDGSMQIIINLMMICIAFTIRCQDIGLSPIAGHSYAAPVRDTAL